MGLYYYDGVAYTSVDILMAAVRRDIDFCFGDADLDVFIRSNGGVYVDGEECMTSLSLKRHSHKAYLEVRTGIIADITEEIRDGVESSFFPIQVPFTYNLIECSE